MGPGGCRWLSILGQAIRRKGALVQPARHVFRYRDLEETWMAEYLILIYQS